MEWEATICTLLEITDQKSLLESNPLHARSAIAFRISIRFGHEAKKTRGR
jgi:hypothetical protein